MMTSRARISGSRRTVALAIFFFVQALLILQVAIVSRLLRPLDDDYCIADRSRSGLLGGLFSDPDSTATFLTPSVLTDLLVGQPLNHAPSTLGSSISFWAAALSMGALASVLLTLVYSNGQTRDRLLVASIGLLLIPAWWGYQWASLRGTVPDPSQIALATTHWQNINSAYVVPTALMASLTLLLAFRSARGDRSIWSYILATCAGVGTGLMSPVYSISVISVVTLIGVFMIILGKHIAYDRLLPILIFVTLTLMGIFFSLLNPASLARMDSYSQNPNLSPQWTGFDGSDGSTIGLLLNFRSVLTSGFAFSLQTTWSQLWNLGGLLVVGLASAIGFAVSAVKERRHQQSLALVAIALLWTAFISNTFSSVAGSVIGLSAYYHSLYGQVMAFGVLIASGLFAGSKLRERPRITGTATSFSILLIALTLEFSAVQFMSDSVYERHATWEAGPAPIEGVGFDREQPSIETCWRQVDRHQSLGA